MSDAAMQQVASAAAVLLPKQATVIVLPTSTSNSVIQRNVIVCDMSDCEIIQITSNIKHIELVCAPLQESSHVKNSSVSSMTLHRRRTRIHTRTNTQFTQEPTHAESSRTEYQRRRRSRATRTILTNTESWEQQHEIAGRSSRAKTYLDYTDPTGNRSAHHVRRSEADACSTVARTNPRQLWLLTVGNPPRRS